MTDLVFLPAFVIAELIRTRQVSAVEVSDQILAQIEQHNVALNAIITLDAPGARQRAAEADAALAQGILWGPLHGVPITLKDVHDTAGIRSTFGSPAFADRIAPEDSPVAARLKKAGAVLLGKTNPELFPDNPFGLTRNPWDLARSAGGSSSGAAAAVAAGMSTLDVGSDMGGSNISPAHLSGVYAMRPTERRVPLGRFFLDQAAIWRVQGVLGPIARSVTDLRLALRVLSGSDRHDTEVPPVVWREQPLPELRSLRVAWTDTILNVPVMAEIRNAIGAFADKLESYGVTIEQRQPPVDFAAQIQLAQNIFGLLVSAFGDESPKLSEYFLALEARDQLIAQWETFFDDWDVFLCPADNVLAQLLTELDKPLHIDGQVVENPDWSPCWLSAAIGNPAVAMPLAHGPSGLPIGIQVMGRRWDDERVLNICEMLAYVTPGFQRPPR